MKRAKITHKDGRKWQADQSDFSSEAAFDAWKNEQILKNSWGLPERIVEAIPGSYDPSDVLEEIPEVIEGDVTVSPAKVRLRAEYTVEIEDISQEVAAREAAKAKLQAAKDELKLARQLVVDAKDATTDAKQRQVLVKLAKAILQLSKAQGIANVNESEE
jgi:hypothetical protein